MRRGLPARGNNASAYFTARYVWGWQGKANRSGGTEHQEILVTMQVFRRPANPMQWNRLFRNKAPGTDIWAALCEARADGSDPAHQSGVRYPLLVMVRSSEDELEGKVFSLLKTYGWQEPQVKRL